MTIQFLTKIGPGYFTRATFAPMHFPAGEAHLTIRDDDTTTPRTQLAYLTGCDPDDLVMLAMWADACHRRDEPAVALIPYLPGARADRGTPFGAHVYAQLLNAMNLDQVICLDPHSPVMPSLLNNVTVIEADAIIRPKQQRHLGLTGFVGVIAPDAGAHARAARVAEALEVPVYQAAKHRDFATGKLSRFSCEPLPAAGRLLVVDDICDGGGTFRGLAEATGVPRERLTLWVSHGVFSGSAETLFDHYGAIVTTDSHPGAARLGALGATVIPLRPYLLSAVTVDAYAASWTPATA